MNKRSHYQFPPMLGPASAQPEGSYEWAECWGNELEYHAENLEYEVGRFADLVRKLVAANPPPWNVFPEPPCQNIDSYLRLCCQVAAVLMAFGLTSLASTILAMGGAKNNPEKKAREMLMADPLFVCLVKDQSGDKERHEAMVSGYALGFHSAFTLLQPAPCEHPVKDILTAKEI